jgi:signal transduction histidine kinase
LTKNSVYNIKFQKVPNIRIDDSALTKQENIETETSKKLNTIDGIKDSNIIRQVCLDSISSANEEILIFFPTANSFLRYEKIGAIETLSAVVRQRNVGVRILVPHHLLIEKFVEQKPFLLDITCNIKTDKEDNINVESIRFIQETSGTRATILVIDKNILLVTGLEDDIEKSFEAVAGFSTYSTDVSRIFPYISIFENLWAQAGLYHQVKKANEKLIMQDKKYKEFISVAAHELRTPIQPIIGLSYLLKYEKESLVGKEEESLDIIVRNAVTLSKLAENILDLNKIENDNLMLKKEIFDLDKLILDVISDLEKQLLLHHHHHNYHQKYAKSKIELRYHNQQSSVVYDEVDEGNDMGINALQLKRGFENSVEIEADKVRIYQVISNLINNAIKSIDDVTGMDGEKAGEIIISMRYTNSYQLATYFDYQIDHNKGYNDNNYSDERNQNGRCPISSDTVAIVSVTDTGRGIDLEILPRLFTRFATSFKTGTGLGLFISKSIIEAHNGKIWAYNNKEGQGATFQFSLPLRK